MRRNSEKKKVCTQSLISFLKGKSYSNPRTSTHHARVDDPATATLLDEAEDMHAILTGLASTKEDPYA